MVRRPCIAIVSPFLDKRHGTERCVAEQAERLAHDHDFEMHLFTQRVEDIPGVLHAHDWRASSRANQGGDGCLGILVWHRVADIPGPQLLKYIWWFAANHIYRWAARRQGVRYDLVYSPGVNCFDADLISVHIVFAEFVHQVRDELKLGQNAVRFWPRLVHRRLYYRLLMALERRIYGRPDQALVAVSRKVAEDLKNHCGRNGPLPLVYHGLDLKRFNPQRRAELRPASRRVLNLSAESFALLLVGNDFKKKGLGYAVQAVAMVSSPRLHLLVVGEDDPAPYAGLIQSAGLQGRVRFLPIRPDVEFYYAAADLYAGPSLEDAFALPPAEAMACGVPAIVSRRAGVSEIITHEKDGLILEDPTDVQTLSRHMQSLLEQDDRRTMMGELASRTAEQYTWEKNVEEMKQLILEMIAARQGARAAGGLN